MFVAFIFNATSVSAAINTTYSATDPVADSSLEEAFEESTLLEALAKLIYALGQFFEWVLSIIFKMLTGSSDFPWADKIVFNAVPLLDVNFINPGGTSDLALKTFVGQPDIQSVLKNLYATVLAIAVSFFGIVVMITAIKLVISTIASEKAKYKQALVDWATGLVMLFCMHFFISFIFYLNEQLVVVASQIVTEQLKVKSAIAEVESSDLATELIDSMGDTIYVGDGTDVGPNKGRKIKDILNENHKILEVYINLSSDDSSKGIHEMLMKDTAGFGWDIAIDNDSQKQYLAMIISWAAEENISLDDLKNIYNNHIMGVKFYTSFWENAWIPFYGQGISNTDIVKIFGKHTSEIAFATDYIRKTKKDTSILNSKKDNNYSKTLSNDEKIWGSAGVNDIVQSNLLGSVWKTVNTAFCEYYWTDVLQDLYKLKAASNTNSGTYKEGSGKSSRLIADLASYFKQNAAEKTFRSTNITGLKNTGNINIENMIMYAILVVQSLILFIAYIKRLFYVIMLAMMAPIVVVYDFFQRFGK